MLIKFFCTDPDRREKKMCFINFPFICGNILETVELLFQGVTFSIFFQFRYCEKIIILQFNQRRNQIEEENLSITPKAKSPGTLNTKKREI